jgi:hypothetical protein
MNKRDCNSYNSRDYTMLREGSLSNPSLKPAIYLKPQPQDLRPSLSHLPQWWLCKRLQEDNSKQTKPKKLRTVVRRNCIKARQQMMKTMTGQLKVKTISRLPSIRLFRKKAPI